MLRKLSQLCLSTDVTRDIYDHFCLLVIHKYTNVKIHTLSHCIHVCFHPRDFRPLRCLVPSPRPLSRIVVDPSSRARIGSPNSRFCNEISTTRSLSRVYLLEYRSWGQFSTSIFFSDFRTNIFYEFLQPSRPPARFYVPATLEQPSVFTL